MGKDFDALTDVHREWIAEQHLFFVATAPLSGDGHVNMSPKGYDTFRVLDERTVAYLDLTGSGIETISHLRENSRLTIMFVAFEGRPRILRLYGSGSTVLHDEPGFDELAAQWGHPLGSRSIVRLDIERVRSSCGYSIPFMDYTGERETLAEWSANKGTDGIEQYWDDRNAVSLDGMKGL
jgi:hypothetical protein